MSLDLVFDSDLSEITDDYTDLESNYIELGENPALYISGERGNPVLGPEEDHLWYSMTVTVVDDNVIEELEEAARSLSDYRLEINQSHGSLQLTGKLFTLEEADQLQKVYEQAAESV